MSKNGLIYAFQLDGNGGAKQLEWDDLSKLSPDDGPLWLHFDYSEPGSIDWISNHSNLDPLEISALLTEESRPRASQIGTRTLIALRGVNLSPGSDPEDMVAIRLCVDNNRIISTRKRKLLSVSDIASSFANQQGPKTTGEFLCHLTRHLISRMEGTILGIDDRVDQVEEQLINSESHTLRSKLSEIRRESIMLRRYLTPQKEAMQKLLTDNLSWLSDTDRLHLRETTDRLIRYTEDLDSIRDRAAVTQEELINRLSEQMNTRMYVLSVISAVFLPLGFLTGLLGINVGGIPGADNSSAFIIFIVIIIAIVIMQLIFFKRKKWF